MVESGDCSVSGDVSERTRMFHTKTRLSTTRPSKMMRGSELTERQLQTLDAIRKHIKLRGVPPTRSELCKALKINYHSAVSGHLNALARKGWIELLPVDRGIRLLREGLPILDADELPAVAADNPVVAWDQPEPARLHDFDSLAEQWETRPDWFVRVIGTSMSKVGFHPGDVLAVTRNPDPRNGDIVVVRIGDEVVVKRFCRVNASTIELQSESHDP